MMSDITPDAGSLGIIINQYKGAATREARQNGQADFAWQPRFFDHIIRSEKALRRIQHYIQANPQEWPRDRNHPDRL